MVQDKSIIFQNEIYSDIVRKLQGGIEVLGNSKAMLHHKVFKLFESTADRVG